MPGALPDEGARAAPEPVRRTASTGIVAAVTVTQAHAFRLSDLLGTYDVAASDALLRPRIINPQIEGTIYETTAAVARKVRQLARNRTIKLNLARQHCLRAQARRGRRGRARRHGLRLF